MKDNQVNSFPCRVCCQVFTEESGASKDFVCENCKSFKRGKYYNQKETIKTIKRHLKGIETAITKLEKE
jgi:transcription initiation factor IIE alpha subunit